MAKGTWDEHLREPDDEAELERKAKRLVNSLANYPGPAEYKLAFCKWEIPAIEALADGAGLTDPRRRSGFIVAKAISYYKWRIERGEVARATTKHEQREQQLKAELRVRNGSPDGESSDCGVRETALRVVAGGGER